MIGAAISLVTHRMHADTFAHSVFRLQEVSFIERQTQAASVICESGPPVLVQN